MLSVAQWEIFDWELKCNKPVANPFLDIEIQARFTCGDTCYDVDGFYDGDNIWRVRFAPPQQGVWHGETYANAAELHGQQTEFVSVEPISRGGLCIHPDYPHWFFRQDGKAQWVVNDGWYPHPLFEFRLDFEALDFPKPTEEDMRLYLEVLGQHKVNMTIEVDQLYARQTSLEDDSFNWPWKVTDARTNHIDRDFFNLEYYRRMERTLQCAKDNGVFYGFEVLFDNSVFRSREWGNHPLNVRNGGWLEGDAQGTGWGSIFDLNDVTHVTYIRRYIRYTVARLAAYWNLYWALGAESGNLSKVPGRECPAERIADWYSYWGDYIERKDPYKRLQAIGDTGEIPSLILNRHNNFTITQEHTSMEDLHQFCSKTSSFGHHYWQYGRPTIIGEQDRHNLDHYDTERKGYWVAFASGFLMGRVDRHFGVADHGMLMESKLFHIDGVPPIYRDLLAMSEFVEKTGIAFWKMSPSDELLIKRSHPDVFCLADSGKEYLLYFAHEGTAEIMLPAVTAQWYHPVNRTYLPAENLIAGYHCFETPESGDWVLHLRAFNSQS